MRLLITFGMLAVLVSLTSCSTVRSEGNEDFAVVDGETYAWATLISGDPNEYPYATFQNALDVELESLGLRKAEEGEPRWLLAVTFIVEKRVYENDPNFTPFVLEQVEDGNLILEFMDPSAEEIVWTGSSTRRLRTESRTMGGARPRWVQTGNERDWNVATAAKEIASELRKARATQN